MLEQLSKRDQEWRVMAYNICKCKTISDDLVNEMYLRVHKSNRIEIPEVKIAGYVLRVLKSVFIDHVRKEKKTVSLENVYNLTHEEDETTERRFELLDMISYLSFFQREVLLQTHEKSLRECQKDTGVYYRVLDYHKQKGLKKLRKKYNK